MAGAFVEPGKELVDAALGLRFLLGDLQGVLVMPRRGQPRDPARLEQLALPAQAG